MKLEKFYYEPQLVPLDRLEPALYNPREADQDRLNYLKYSLENLGFILPLYATENGHLLSGHQRLAVATDLGCESVPVIFLPDMNDGKRKNINLLFNRATNDMTNKDNSEVFLNELQGFNLEEAVEGLSTKNPKDNSFFPCMSYELVPVGELTDQCSKQYDGQAVGNCRRLFSNKIVMPAVRSESGTVINGVYRVYAFAEEFGPDELYPVVTIPDNDAQVAEAMVNLISMRFTVEDQFANILRYGGFRRPTNKVEDLVKTMRYFVDGNTSKPAHKSLAEPEVFWHKWRKKHGETVIDFGAGQCRNELILEKKGIDCVSWEPYPCDWQGITGDNGDKPSLTLAQMLTDTFLERVADGTVFTSVFASAVLNSVPFYKDRLCCLAIMHACFSHQTRLYGSVQGIGRYNKMFYAYQPNTKIDQEGNVTKQNQTSLFTVPYEENVILADITKAPKIQKYHTPEGLEKMLKLFWRDVSVYDNTGTYIFFEAGAPKRVNPKTLKEAIELEFNLPYPEEQSLNRTKEALEAFGKRHNINFEKVNLGSKK